LARPLILGDIPDDVDQHQASLTISVKKKEPPNRKASKTMANQSHRPAARST